MTDDPQKALPWPKPRHMSHSALKSAVFAVGDDKY